MTKLSLNDSSANDVLPPITTQKRFDNAEADSSPINKHSVNLVSRRLSWFQSNKVIWRNASSLMGTTFVASGLGFIYWWLAARYFSLVEVGIASAAISAMILLGTIGMLGLGTLIISEIPNNRESLGALITTALLIAGTSGALLGVVFALLAPLISPELKVLSDSVLTTIIFAFGVGLTAATQVLDQALVGMLRGELQLCRNTLFAILKLLLLLAAGILITNHHGITIYTTWMLSAALSMVLLIKPSMLNPRRFKKLMPRWKFVRSMSQTALGHHVFNLALQAPGLVLPLIVTALLSTKVNASFYIAWMIAAFIFASPISFTTTLYAVGTAQPEKLAQKFRTTLSSSLIIGGAGCLVIWITADYVLHIFGASYAEQASWCLRILALAVLPMTIRYHFIALCRLNKSIVRTIPLIMFGAATQLSLAAAGALLGGLTGLSIGWFSGLLIEASYTSIMIYRSLWMHKASNLPFLSTETAITTKTGHVTYPSLQIFWPLAIWLPLLTIAEVLNTQQSQINSLFVYSMLLALLVAQATLARSQAVRYAATATILAPLTRIIALSLPTKTVTPFGWYVLMAVMVGLMLYATARCLQADRRALGWQFGNLALQTLLIPITAGVLSYFYFGLPITIPGSLQYTHLQLAMTLVLAVIEASIFAGLMLYAAKPLLGRWSSLWSALLFSTLQASRHDPLELACIMAISMMLIFIADRSHSSFGAGFALALINVGSNIMGRSALILSSIGPLTLAEKTNTTISTLPLVLSLIFLGLLLLRELISDIRTETNWNSLANLRQTLNIIMLPLGIIFITYTITISIIMLR